ncbi:MAG: ribosome recycling factor [bacterium]
MIKKIIAEMEDSMKKSIEKIKGELSVIRTGRANASLLEGIKVDYYGSHMTIHQIAGVSVPGARTIEIKPWDQTAVPLIEKAIMNSGLGVTPVNDGKVIHLNLPALTQERRVELVKVIKKIAEDFKVSVRNARRDAIEQIKKGQKDKVIPEDLAKFGEHDVQRITDSFVKKIDETVAQKEKEIMEV